MLVVSKKIKYFHKIVIEYDNGKNKVMITDFDVAVGDICKIRIGKEIIDTKVVEAKKLKGEHIIDPRIISIAFEVDEFLFDKYDRKNNYIYKVKPINDNYNNYDNETIFTSSVKLPEKTLVVSKNTFGIIDEEIYSTNVIIENEVLKAYQCIINEAVLIFNCGIVPRYLMNELQSLVKIKKESHTISSELEDALFKKIVIEDDFIFDYEEDDITNYLINSARLGHKACIKIMKDLSDSNDRIEEFEYWSNKVKKIV